MAGSYSASSPADRETWTVDDSFRYCEELARSHYENFPVGSFLIPANLRQHFCAIYAFARTADDFADEGYSKVRAEDRLALLAGWGEMLTEAFCGRARHPIFVALAETSARFNLPINLFQDLLSAFKQDATQNRYADFNQLLDYCRRSANPIGRLILTMFGQYSARRPELSDSICTALQLTNHWQDLAIDLRKDRIYLPAEDMDRFGVSVDSLRAGDAGPRFKSLMSFEIGRAREFFRSGRPLCTEVRGRLGLELRVIWLSGWRILEKIEENQYDVFARRPSITAADKARIVATVASKTAFNLR